MPSRKSNASSEVSSDSRRTSLRRLSSIASFQNLFSRRRSQHVSDQHASVSSSSDLSASTSSVDTTLKATGSVSSANLIQHNQDGLAELPTAPPPTHSNNRRSSYICLPDDPIGGMPRSRTFSNLPVPSRAKKVPIVGSHSHYRLPSALLPSTRLPSPPGSTRKHSHTRLTSGEVKAPPARGVRMKRSDTEPLLGLEAGYGTNSLPRSTAFKENISLSPIKPLPAIDTEYQGKHSRRDSWWDGIDVPQAYAPVAATYSPPPPPPISKYASHPAVQMVRNYKSSPVRPLYRSSRERPPTPGASSLNPPPQHTPAQRWNSQPVLTARQNNYEHPTRKDSKAHKEIKQTRLMSARQAPTPQPPKTPVAKQIVTSGSKVKAANNSSSAGHVREASEHTPTQPQPTTSSVPPTTAGQVTTYEPPAYWAGRLSSLADRYRNEELAALLHSAPDKPATEPQVQARATSYLSLPSISATNSTATLTPKAKSDKMHTPEASAARLKRALEELNSRCATHEAKESLFAFQMQFASVMGLPELRPARLVLHLGGDGAASGGGEDVGGVSESRKASFMDRLLGKGKRRSLVLG